MKTGERIKQIRKLLNKSQEELAKEIGITKQAISNIEKSKSAPGLNLLSKLLIDYNVNLNFIIAGVGNMFVIENNSYNSIKKEVIKEVELFLELKGIK